MEQEAVQLGPLACFRPARGRRCAVPAGGREGHSAWAGAGPSCNTGGAPSGIERNTRRRIPPGVCRTPCSTGTGPLSSADDVWGVLFALREMSPHLRAGEARAAAPTARHPWAARSPAAALFQIAHGFSLAAANTRVGAKINATNSARGLCPLGDWRVQVQAADEDGTPIENEAPRWHSTPPDRDARAAGVLRRGEQALTMRLKRTLIHAGRKPARQTGPT
jgi:hypothetical protein